MRQRKPRKGSTTRHYVMRWQRPCCARCNRPVPEGTFGEPDGYWYLTEENGDLEANGEILVKFPMPGKTKREAVEFAERYLASKEKAGWKTKLRIETKGLKHVKVER